jgi:hypothetical protein
LPLWLAAYAGVTDKAARIEASGSADLTRICLEEALAALGQALIAPDRWQVVPREPLTRARTIMVWLARSVTPGHPLQASLKAFHGGLASQIAAHLQQADARMVAIIQIDIRDILEVAG